MPNNFLHIGLIQLILPNAKIIDARRHPMASCFSAFKQHFARGQHFSYDLADIGRYYRDYVELMAHFDAVLPGRVHRRDLRGHGRGHRGARSAACSPIAACRSSPPASPSTKTTAPSAPSAPSRCAGRSSARAWTSWRHYEPWLGPLKAALGPALADWRE